MGFGLELLCLPLRSRPELARHSGWLPRRPAMDAAAMVERTLKPRRQRRRDLNVLDPDDIGSDTEDPNDGIPEVGLVFNDHLEVNRFYRRYARRVGFGVSVRRSSFDQEKVCIYLELVCCKGGEQRYEPKFRKRASSITNCKAKMRVKRGDDGRLHVEAAVLEHNHPVSPSMARFLNTYKQLSGADKRKMRLGGAGALPVEEPSRMPIDRLEPLEGLLFGESEQRNMGARGQLKFGMGDAESLRLFFTKMQARNPNFFSAIDLNDDGRVRNVFWADARSRAAYENFNDVIMLDTSYLSANFEMPLCTFVGVNHHGLPILLGCCLLADQTKETYVWLFKTLIACMAGIIPVAMITDYCLNIRAALTEVLPLVRHRMCLFQIMKKISEKLGGLVPDHRPANRDLQKAVYESLRKEEFVEEWANKLQKHGLHGDEWLRSLFQFRECWVPAFLRDTFWAGMSATHPNDAVSPFFEGYVDSKTSLKQFLKKYELAMQSKYEKEAQADFETFHKKQPPVSKFYMEEQLSNLYTHNMFKKFQDEIEAIMYCHTIITNIEQSSYTYNVRECIFMEDGKKHKNKTFSVVYNAEEKAVNCICGAFQFTGILCRHALSVLKFAQVYEIPPGYILDRWKKEFKHLQVMARPQKDVVPNNRVDRYDYLSMRCLQLVDVAVLTDKYQLSLRMIREMEKFLLNEDTHEGTSPRIKSRIPRANRLNKINSQDAGKSTSEGCEAEQDGQQEKEKDPLISAATGTVHIEGTPKVGGDISVAPTGYIGIPANVQQFIGAQAALRPGFVYMLPSGVNPQTLGNQVLMPLIYQQPQQVLQNPNGSPGHDAESMARKRKRGRKPKMTTQELSATSVPPTNLT